MFTYQNPIIKGFNPDPSICRVGKYYYLVTSSFEFFPGVPLYRSENLVNWEMLGHCLTSEEQLPLRECYHSGGIYAPTIRYHDGIFYMTTTNASSIRNFIVHTDDLEKGWSAPVLVQQKGIDPSLFFDTDGKVYYTSTAYTSEHKNAIQMCEINPITGEAQSESRIITYGCGGCYPEAPHIYKRNEYYYLLLAEGGSEYNHHATIQRSDNIWGPYSPSPYNPFVYNQSTQGESLIQAVGHADIIEDTNGNWWAVCLGIRKLPYGLLHNLGRETFLIPFTWTSDGWPITETNGIVTKQMQGPLPFAPIPEDGVFKDDFSGNKLLPDWTFLRNPSADCCSLTKKAGCLTLCGNVPLSDPAQSPGLMCVRQKEHNMCAETTLSGELSDKQRAGIVAYYTCKYHYEAYLKREENEYFICVNRRVHDLEFEVVCEKIDYKGEIDLYISSDERKYYLGYKLSNGLKKQIAECAVAGLCTEGTDGMTFTGTFIGLFTVGGEAEFTRFEMKPI